MPLPGRKHIDFTDKQMPDGIVPRLKEVSIWLHLCIRLDMHNLVASAMVEIGLCPDVYSRVFLIVVSDRLMHRASGVSRRRWLIGVQRFAGPLCVSHRLEDIIRITDCFFALTKKYLKKR